MKLRLKPLALAALAAFASPAAAATAIEFHSLDKPETTLRSITLDASGCGSMALERHLSGLNVKVCLVPEGISLLYTRERGRKVVHAVTVKLSAPFTLPAGVEPPTPDRPASAPCRLRLEAVKRVRSD